VSVSQRFRSIPIEPYSSGLYTSISAVTRAFFGALFGALFMLLHKGGVLLAFAADRLPLLYAAAFVAGFSERLMPEVLERFERTVSDSTKAEKGM